MSSSTGFVKATAKENLSKNWTRVILACLIGVFTVFIFYNLISILQFIAGSVVSNILAIISAIFIIFPVFMGILRFIWRMYFEVEDSPVYVFYWFSKKVLYIKCIKFIFALAIRLVLWSLLFNIPSILAFTFSKSFIYEAMDMAIPIWTANLSVYVGFLRTIANFALFFVMLKYYLAPFLFVADDQIEIDEAILMSRVISRKSAIDFVYLVLSLIGWILLSVLIVPLVFTLPYFMSAYIAHAQLAINEYNNHINELTKHSTPTFMVGA